jgi:ribosomal protein S1
MVKKLSEGDIVEGVVRNRTKTGVFVELQPNLVGLAEHVSGIEYGQKVLVSIKRIIPEKKKIKLIIIG